MPFVQLRELVVKLIEPAPEPPPALEIDKIDEIDELDEIDEIDEPTSEFETQLTTCVPRPPRTNTLDELIAALRAAPPPRRSTTPSRTRKRM
jgi:hypothetical protein